MALARSSLLSRSLARSGSSRSLFTNAPSPSRRRARLYFGAGLVLGGSLLIYAHDSRAGLHRWLVIPALHALTVDDPEKSHTLAVKVLSSPFAPVDKGQDDEEVLGFELWGRRFSNPIGLAAGFDKHAEAIDGLMDLGFGYVEIGSVTPDAQPGNPKPRFFRLPESQSVINRYGFNSEGHAVILSRLRERIIAFARSNALVLPASLYQFPAEAEVAPITPIDQVLSSPAGRDAAIPDAVGVPRSLRPGQVLGVNLGKNKASNPDSLEDYLEGVRQLGPYADVLVINVSSPNTPGLRSLQRRGMLEELLSAVLEERDKLQGAVKPAVVVKISPDLTAHELEDVGEAALEAKIDGVIVSNTTISRPAEAGTSPTLLEVGGLSGPPVKHLAIKTLATLHIATEGKIPLIGCGGIATAQDAIDFARAGASFVQLYTSFGYQGPGLPRELKDDLSVLLRNDHKRWSELVGIDAQHLAPPKPAKPDPDTETLRRELERVLADLAEGRNVSIPHGGAPFYVQTAADISSEPGAHIQHHTSASLVAPMPVITLHEQSIPFESEADHTRLPEAVLPDVVEAVGRSLGKVAEAGADASAQATVVASDALKQALGRVEDPAAPTTGRERVPLAKLFSSFGERQKAGESGKRIV